jgi:capsular polysaccharide biosynthesis protein
LFTQLVGPITRRLPRAVPQSGPPRYVTNSTRDYAWTHPDAGIAVVEVAPKTEIERTAPIGLPSDHWAFTTRTRDAVPANVVARIPNGRVVEHYGAVITDDNTLLFDLSPYFGSIRGSQHPLYLRARLPHPHVVPGSLGVLTTRGSDNYYHFLTDVLPRLDLMARAGVSVDRFVVNRTMPFQSEMLNVLGIGEDRCIQSADHPHVQADELVVSSLPDAQLCNPAWVAPWLREKFRQAEVQPPHRRLYLSRGTKKHTRRVENEAELLAALEPYGFVSIDPGALPVAEQIKVFSESEIVIGAHGAALTNIVFCPAGASVIELFSPDYVNVCFWTLACTLPGLRYRYVVGNGAPTTVRSNRGVASDVRVDPSQVVRVLEALS